MTGDRPFLTAQWRHLVMLNYAIEPDILEPLIPLGTELDFWQGRALVSVVGFQFLKSRLKGWPIPWHQNFAEVNLRFYVRREVEDGWRRGVVFVKEIVAKPAVSWVANTIYHENYVTAPMLHRVQIPGSTTDRTGLIEYGWRSGSREYCMTANFIGLPQPFAAGSEEEFITEHYWGYTRRRDGSTAEYRVDHPAWRVWQVDKACFRGNVAAFYGPQFGDALSQPPCSALVAEGSAVVVYEGRCVPAVTARCTLNADWNRQASAGM